MSIADFARRAAKLAIDHSPSILTSLGVVGAVTTAYLAGKASFEANDIIRLKEASDEQRGVVQGTPREVLKDRIELVWRLYIPSIATGAGTIVCIVGANHISNRRAAGLAAAFGLVEKASHEYKNKVIEKIGERKEGEIRDAVVQDRITDSWDDSIEVHGKTDGDIFYDKFSDRYVYQTQEGLRSLVNDLNQSILHQGYATAADFYYLVGMPAPIWAQELGWNSDGRMMELRFSSALTPAGKPVNAFEFSVDPVRSYARFH